MTSAGEDEVDPSKKRPKLVIQKEMGVWWTRIGKTTVGAHLTGSDAIANLGNSNAVAMAAIKGALRAAMERARHEKTAAPTDMPMHPPGDST
jgi:hypothetical protein